MSRTFTLALTAAALLAALPALPSNYPVDDGYRTPNGNVGGPLAPYLRSL